MEHTSIEQVYNTAGKAGMPYCAHFFSRSTRAPSAYHQVNTEFRVGNQAVMSSGVTYRKPRCDELALGERPPGSLSTGEYDSIISGATLGHAVHENSPHMFMIRPARISCPDKNCSIAVRRYLDSIKEVRVTSTIVGMDRQVEGRVQSSITSTETSTDSVIGVPQRK